MFPLPMRFVLKFHKKRGMGSSAAVSIAAIRAVFDYFEQSIDMNTLEILVNKAEIIAHSNPSGLMPRLV